MTARAPNYSNVAIFLHWSIAVLVLANISLVELTGEMARDARTPYMDLHKAIGVSVLALTVFRVGWRIGHPPPPLPRSIPDWQRRAAALSHGLFYVLLIALPLTGWLWMSAIPAPVTYFGLGNIPLWPVAGSEPFAVAMRQLHQILSQTMIALIVLHILGAAKHSLIDKDGITWRMLPWR